ncbi:DNA-methyltransferase [Schinkia azotoformans]|uniref:DNA-methyltransferase n=1 Tax=Schinkia azotoformans TaxID=1454 RepID=UPI002DB778F6|nr:site-specific DNA-methyltransferase [Schinkia azotoformans]MEC1757506.1 site-specific DNA-methyltransferase [Schinkia azotoformans]
MNEEFLNKVLHGDCLEWLPQIADKSIDLIVIDQKSPHFFRNDEHWRFPSEEIWQKLQSTGQFQKDYRVLVDEFNEIRTKFENGRYTHNLDENHNNVWRFQTENRGKFHPTQKPLSVIERIIKASSNPGDVVLDCFLGSGTTAVAGINLDRNFIGIEKDWDYCNVANERINQAKLLKAIKE